MFPGPLALLVLIRKRDFFVSIGFSSQANMSPPAHARLEHDHRAYLLLLNALVTVNSPAHDIVAMC